jgi:hypothetical protein
MVTGLLFGLAPALQAASGKPPGSPARRGPRQRSGVRKNRLRNALVIAEIALSLVLLVGASLFVRSFLSLQNMSPGFSTASIMTTRFDMQGSRYDSLGLRAQRAEDIVQRIEALPGVQSAFVSGLIPATGGAGGGEIVVEGRAVQKGDEPFGLYAGISEHFFAHARR